MHLFVGVGPVNVAAKGGIDCKLGLLIKELERYQLCVAGIIIVN